MILLWTAFAPVLTAQIEVRPLTADEVLVVANLNDVPSEKLARHYIAARGIPESQLLITGMGRDEEIKRGAYDRLIAGPIKQFLIENDLRRVRCIALMHGVPLRVLEPPVTLDMRRLRVWVEKQQIANLRRAAAIVARVDALAAENPLPQPPPVNPSGDLDAQRGEMAEHARRAFAAAAGRITAQADSDPALYAAWWDRWIEAMGFGLPREMNVAEPSPPPDRARPDNARRVGQLMLEPLTPGSAEELLRLADQDHGALGAVRVGGILTKRLQPDWTHQASVDSELCTLLWPPLTTDGSKPNPLHHRRRGRGRSPPTLMVCRLDAPDETIVREMIDASLRVESEGLRGKVYIDARGRPPADGGYGLYDGDLRKLALFLRRETSLTVVLDDQEPLFQPGACPDAAVYCGWYSLAQYIDAFDFVPGAVAYHVASSEAVSLRRPGSTMWCPALLEDGVAATLGPVAEPYVSAFPLASEFFGLLMIGELTLADCYYLTAPNVSWMMTLIGDPLYRPFAANPILTPESFEKLFNSPLPETVQ